MGLDWFRSLGFCNIQIYMDWAYILEIGLWMEWRGNLLANAIHFHTCAIIFASLEKSGKLP